MKGMPLLYLTVADAHTKVVFGHCCLTLQIITGDLVAVSEMFTCFGVMDTAQNKLTGFTVIKNLPIESYYI